MKISLLHYAAPPVVGGVESVLSHQALLMADHGHEVNIIAGRGDQIDERIPFIHLPVVDSRNPDVLRIKSELDSGRVPEGFWDLVAKLTDTLAEVLENNDIVIAHNVCSLSKNLPLTAALKNLSEKSRKPRLILWHHDLAWTTPRYRSELYDGYPWDLIRTNWPGVVQVVVSKLRQRELSKLMGIQLEKVNVVPNGLDIDRFLKLENYTLQLIQQLDLLSAQPLFLLPVRITPRKNIEMALRIIAAIRDIYPQAVLVVTGPLGPHNPANEQYFQKLKSMRRELSLENNVHFLAELSDEYLPDSVVSDLYRVADVLLMPSREEGFGIPILEAGLTGIPAYCADIPPLRELGGEFVTYFSPDSRPEAVSELIVDSLSQDPTYLLKVKVRSQFTWERIYLDRIAPLLEM